jgi:uncharacterized protein (TIGR02246 family)
MKTGIALSGALVLVVLIFLVPDARAATAPPLDPTGGRVKDREQLRTLLDQMEHAISTVDIDAALKLMHPQAIVVWQNAEVSRGHEQIRAYHDRMVKGAAPIVTKFSTKATLGGPAVFYADSAVAYGTAVDTFELSEGLKFTLNSNWSTTAVKQDGHWKVAALHFSTDLFDNPLLNNAKRMMWVAGAVAFVVGLIVALLLSRLLRKKAG